MKPQDIEDLKQLIDFLKENQVAEFDLDRGDLKIRLKFDQQHASAGGNVRPGADALRRTGLALLTRRAPAFRLPRLPPRQTRMPACTLSSRPSSAPSMARPRPARRRLSPPAIRWKKAR